MTDWQTSLMQHVADPTPYDSADFFRLTGANVPASFFPRGSSPSDHASSSMLPTIRSSTSVKHSGQLLPECMDLVAVRELVALSLRLDAPQPIDSHLDSLVGRGLSAEHIFLRILQPAARRLGELWAADICTFVDVTLALTALQSGMRHLMPRFHQHGRPAQEMRTIILSTLGGDQHTFGLTMTAEFFRRSGWTVFSVTSGSGDEVAQRVRGERNAVVGFSLSRADQLPDLSSAIRRLRQPGRPRPAGILVGGPLLSTNPDCARGTGADAVGLDARQALTEAEALAAGGDGA